MFLVIAGGLLFADLSGWPQARSFRRWTAWAMQPITWLSTVPHFLDDITSDLKSRNALLRENAALRRRELILSAQALRMNALESENQRLRNLLSASSTIHQKMLIAQIIKTSQSPYSYQILINKGSRQGVYRGQALIDAHGVLGQVVRVEPSDSVVLLITDPHNGVPVEVNRTGLQTVALGRGDGQSLSLPFLPRNADVRVGDLLVSSGLGGRFPEGYPVGRVREIKRPPGESFIEAIADPSAHLNRGRQVLLVWSANDAVQHPLPKLPINLEGSATHPIPGQSGRRPGKKRISTSPHSARGRTAVTSHP